MWLIAAAVLPIATIRVAIHWRPLARHERYQKENSEYRGDRAADDDTRQRLLRLRADSRRDCRGKQPETRCHAGHHDRPHLIDGSHKDAALASMIMLLMAQTGQENDGAQRVEAKQRSKADRSRDAERGVGKSESK